MTTRTLLWRGLDEPRMEIVYADSLDQARGTQIGISYELRWRLDGPVLDLEVAGGDRARVELGDADFFDLQHSAFFNSLPAVHDGLIDGGPARDYTMRFVRVPALTAEPYRQRYTPLGNRTVHYSSAGFEADISYGQDGYVDLYQDYLERIG
jgi:hypothetical protein